MYAGPGTIVIVILAVALVVVAIALARARVQVQIASKSKGSDRRRQPRFRSDLPMYYQVMKDRDGRTGTDASVGIGDRWQPASLKDISEGGLCAEISPESRAAWDAMLRGEVQPAFKVRFTKLGREIEAKARAAWGEITRQGPPLSAVAGFQFTELAEADRQVIVQYIRETFFEGYRPAGTRSADEQPYR